MQPNKILILGISGMLGNALFRFFSAKQEYLTYGTVRNGSARTYFPEATHNRIICDINFDNDDALINLFVKIKPHVVINAVGVVKQLADVANPLISLPINSLLPHRLSQLCAICDARFVHMSTDCVFSGKKGGYIETDFPDADDLYGRSKLLGEVDYLNAITLRTSIIGTELSGARSLVGWFLNQQTSIKGYRRAIFSGLPTVEIGRVIHEHILPHPELRGLYHLSVDPISKFDLLNLVAKVYGKKIEIIPDDSLVIDRSLDASRFQDATGFAPKLWPQLIQEMHAFR